MTSWTPEPTGDRSADAILDGLQGADELTPDKEIAVYRSALDALGRLLEDQPGQPGLS